MSQAEIAGGKVVSSGELPSKGRRFTDFELVSSEGERVMLSDHRGRRNLVLIFADNSEECRNLLSALAARYQEFRDQESEVLAIVHLSTVQADEVKQRSALPYPVLADVDGSIHQSVGAADAQGKDAAAVYVTDRFGEIFAIYRTVEGTRLPSDADILSWLEFINSQCPECEAPEWPV
jgi:peroxiredoxin